MYRSQLSALLCLVFSTRSLAVGNDLASCLDVECPLQPGTTSIAQCQIADRTLNAVGIATYEVPLPVGASASSTPHVNTSTSTNATLSWTVGVNNIHHQVQVEGGDLDPYKRLIDRFYYLSTPKSIDLTAGNLEYAGCALFMIGEDNKSVFYDSAANDRSKHSYCQTLMGYSCHSSIQKAASDYATMLRNENNSTVSVAASCSAMAAYIQAMLATSCPNLDDATTVTGTPLTGPEAQPKISAEANSTSNCYPTLPKENDMTPAFSYNVTSMVYHNETFPALLGETPLWSVFYPTSNQSTALQEPDVQLLCLRPIDENLDVSAQVNASSQTSVAVVARIQSVWFAFGTALVAAVFLGYT